MQNQSNGSVLISPCESAAVTGQHKVNYTNDEKGCRSIRLGFISIKSLKTQQGKSIEIARGDVPFVSMKDFAMRSNFSDADTVLKGTYWTNISGQRGMNTAGLITMTKKIANS